MSQPDPVLAEMIAQLRAQLEEKEKQLARKDQALALAEVKIQSLEERLAWSGSLATASAVRR